MGDRDGDTDRDEAPTGLPLPRPDRVWRHPAEAALEARQAAAHRRRRARRRVSGTVLGVTGAVVIVLIARTGPADDTLRADVVPAAAPARAPASTGPASFPVDPDSPADGMVLVRAATGAHPVAGALAVREGYVITSSQAIGATDVVVVSWGSHDARGEVVGHDDATDVAVIRLGDGEVATTDDAPAPDAEVGTGDVVSILLESGAASHQTVVAPASATAKADGAPIVGVVELDGRIGEIIPGSPAYDDDGAVVGMATATADDAPAALVPIDLARAVADDIIDDGVVSHAWLGVRARTTDTQPAGALVTATTPDGPADRGGIEAGDVIIAVGRTTVDSMESMVAALRRREPGTTVSVRVFRDGEEIPFAVSLASTDQAA